VWETIGSFLIWKAMRSWFYALDIANRSIRDRFRGARGAGKARKARKARNARQAGKAGRVGGREKRDEREGRDEWDARGQGLGGEERRGEMVSR
jgi:hypothetical protein